MPIVIFAEIACWAALQALDTAIVQRLVGYNFDGAIFEIGNCLTRQTIKLQEYKFY